MRFIAIALFVLGSLIPGGVFAQYTGGNADGSSFSSFCGNDLNGNPAPAITFNALSGSTSFCSFSTDLYSISLATSSSVSFSWSLPSGASIVAIQNTTNSSTVVISFGNTNGTIAVTATNPCGSATSAGVAVTAVSCNNFTGGSNDGFSFASFCGNNLNGTVASPITLSAINGFSSFCSNNREGYSVNVNTGIANNYYWSLPTGSSVTQTATTTFQGVANIQFGSTNGTITVEVTNSCTSALATLPVTATSCLSFSGGINDGFSFGSFCGNDLNGTAATPISLSAINGFSAFCSNNREPYSVIVSTGIADNYYWSSPTGSTLSQTSSTTSQGIANIVFGSTDGNVTVEVSNSCSSAIATLPVTATSCGAFTGGSNDGFSFASFCGDDLNGTVSAPISLSIVNGFSSFCSNNTDGYSVSLTAGKGTSFYWTGPAGSTVTQTLYTFTQGVSNIQFGSSNGNVSVDVSNGCTSAIATLPVTSSSCGAFAGGSNDGFSYATFCGNNLTGGIAAPISLNPISGNSIFCSNNSDIYAVTLATGQASNYYWTGPTGSSLVTQNNAFTSSASNLQLGSTNGSVTVEASNGCTSASAALVITATNCNQFFGGNNDGFTTGIFCANSLNGGAVAPITLNPISGNSAFCFNLGQNYSVSVATGSAYLFSWSSPTGAGVTTQQNSTNSSLTTIGFASTSGTLSVDATNGCSTATSSLVVTGQNCFSARGGIGDGFAVFSFSLVVPVELTSFSARASNDIVELEWITASELNNDFFTVERSLDGETFEKVIDIPGKGTTNEQHTYKTLDTEPFSGKSYYRLRQTDYDGKFEYSSLVLVQLETNNLLKFKIYPNPNNGQFNISFENNWKDKTGHIQIIDVMGRSVYEMDFGYNKKIVVDPKAGFKMPLGAYFIILTVDDQRATRKIIVQ